eukprot:COSAG06_NODE_717_length_12831_cov_52.780003_10_plen_304_part_00
MIRSTAVPRSSHGRRSHHRTRDRTPARPSAPRLDRARSAKGKPTRDRGRRWLGDAGEPAGRVAEARRHRRERELSAATGPRSHNIRMPHRARARCCRHGVRNHSAWLRRPSRARPTAAASPLLWLLLARYASDSSSCEVTVYGDPGVDGYECNEDDSSWHLSAEVDNEDWCEAACGEQQFGRGSCSNTRDWLNDVAEQVARVSEANQVQLAGFERLGGENVACRGPGTAGSADTEGYVDAGRTCISPIYSRADCEKLCRYDIGCYAYEYHRGVWDECRWREAGVTVIAHRPDCVVDTVRKTYF